MDLTENCLICGNDLLNPYRGRVMSPSEIVTFEVSIGNPPEQASTASEAWRSRSQARIVAVHGACLIRDGISLGGRVAELIDWQNEDEQLTDAGRAVMAKGRVA